LTTAAPGSKPRRIVVDPGALRKVRARDLALRFLFGAVVSAVAGLVTLKFGTRLGGLFLAFPATLPASLTLIEEKESREKAEANASGGELGGLGLAAFAIVAYLLLSHDQPVLGLVCALLAWTLVAGGAYLILRRLAPRTWGEDES
jgi:hypothetical protein